MGSLRHMLCDILLTLIINTCDNCKANYNIIVNYKAVVVSFAWVKSDKTW